MRTLYCYIGGSLNDTLHIDSLPMVGTVLYEVNSAEDVQRVIEHTEAKRVMFHGRWLPQRALVASHPHLARYIGKAFNPPAPKPVQRVTTTADDADLLALIDNG